jgi:hypothetical protein
MSDQGCTIKDIFEFQVVINSVDTGNLLLTTLVFPLSLVKYKGSTTKQMILERSNWLELYKDVETNINWD